jgi:hypothetical protein
MNNRFDELARDVAQSATRRRALKKLGFAVLGTILACLGLTLKAEPARNKCLPSGSRCEGDRECCSGLCEQAIINGKKTAICF